MPRIPKGEFVQEAELWRKVLALLATARRYDKDFEVRVHIGPVERQAFEGVCHLIDHVGDRLVARAIEEEEERQQWGRIVARAVRRWRDTWRPDHRTIYRLDGFWWPRDTWAGHYCRLAAVTAMIERTLGLAGEWPAHE